MKTKKLMPRPPKLTFRQAQQDVVRRHAKAFKSLARVSAEQMANTPNPFPKDDDL